jgi:predicted nucleic acid-binding Zn ribbon protein
MGPSRPGRRMTPLWRNTARVYVRERTETQAVCGHHGGSIVPSARPRTPRRATMLYTIALVLVILWLLGLVTSYTMGGFIHILLVIAVVVILLQFFSGRNSL